MEGAREVGFTLWVGGWKSQEKSLCNDVETVREGLINWHKNLIKKLRIEVAIFESSKRYNNPGLQDIINFILVDHRSISESMINNGFDI